MSWITNLFAMKEANTADMAEAYREKAQAEERSDWESVKDANERIRHLYEENKAIHRLYRKREETE